MTQIARLSIRLCLITVLSVMSVSNGYAQVQPPVAGHMILCSGQGSYVVPVDAEGQPTATPHLCAECILMAAATPVLGEAERPVLRLLVVLETAPGGGNVPLLFSSTADARAPPFFV